MKTIFKYPLDTRYSLLIPKDAEVLTVQVQNGHPYIWALIDTDKPEEYRTFYLYATGAPIDTGSKNTYIGTYQSDGYVWHLFEVERIPEYRNKRINKLIQNT